MHRALPIICFGLSLALSGIPLHAADERPVAFSSPQSTVNFTFSQVDVRSFVKIIGEITGRRFIVDEAVKGQITVVAPRVPVAEAYPLFTRILESVGLSLIHI